MTTIHLLPCGHPESAAVAGEDSRRHDDGATLHCGLCAELLRLERALAWAGAVYAIQSACLPRPDVGEDCFDLSSVRFPEAEVCVRDSARYLELRGLLLRNSQNTQVVAILDESEALL